MKRDEYKMTQQVDTTDYKQKYEQALERAKKGECIENIFPELRESEDEKWRKWLIGHLKGYINQTDDKYAEVCKKAIAWLEKQGEQRYWSEEDDSRICQIIDWLSICKTYNPDQKSVCDISMQIAWLKSIKPNHWKPSEEQLRAIINSAQGLYQCKEKEVLLDLYEQLKNL